MYKKTLLFTVFINATESLKLVNTSFLLQGYIFRKHPVQKYQYNLQLWQTFNVFTALCRADGMLFEDKYKNIWYEISVLLKSADEKDFGVLPVLRGGHGLLNENYYKYIYKKIFAIMKSANVADF